MHAVSHSLAHRGPPATRTRARWQPYNSIQSISSTRSPSVSYLNTPASTVSSSPSPTHPPAPCEVDRIRNPPPLPQPPRDLQLREAQKSKYVIGLVDQAVKSLCEIWHPHDIPAVFLTSSRPMVVPSPSTDSLPPLLTKTTQRHTRNTQLPSPISPSTQSYPVSPPAARLPPTSTHTSHRSDPSRAAAPGSRSNLVPIKGFVHEVLRRSRTSGNVLQTALCYLEAVRAKVPELVRQEKMGEGVKGEPGSDDRIVQGDVADDDMSLDSLLRTEKFDSIGSFEDILDTIRIQDGSHRSAAVPLAQQSFSKKPKASSAHLPPLPPLPSPLLCPRRTFLASLILASKFTQDRCYSNRAWAKLSGLPPREIGRCERALGDALEWRLWVGKTPAPAVSTNPHGRAVIRSKSEGDLFAAPSASLGWKSSSSPLGTSEPTVRYDPGLATTSQLPADRSSAGLRRCSTLPVGAFTIQEAPSFVSSHSASLPMLGLETLMCATPTPATVPGAAVDTSFSNPWSSFVPPSHNLESQSQTPSPPTPTLSFSPTSTESSSGDRTIQMTSFIDVPTPSPGQYAPLMYKVSPPGSDLASCPYPAPHVVINPASENTDPYVPVAYEGSSVATLYSYWTM